MTTNNSPYLNRKKTCIVIAGPTAVGKTNFAIKLAKYFNTEIISADSRQCYKELNIGVATPSREELSEAPHYFIGTHSVKDNMNAGIFEQYALQKANEIFVKHDVVVMVGGTGLYIKAFCEGIDEIPAADPAIRNNIIEAYTAKGLQWLQAEVQKNDPLYFSKGEIQNPQRLMRALEVKLTSGKSIVDFQKGASKQRDFDIIKIGLELPRDELYNNINLRVDTMMQQGLLKEVESLQSVRELNALQTVGYKEIFSYFDGNSTLKDAVEQIKINTRHYAKRQMTWFKKSPQWNWVHPLHPVSLLREDILSGM
jgi:tRNA dimethylallyltransferase